MEQPVPISSQFRIMAVLAAIVVILVIVAVLAFEPTTRMIRDRESVAHTQSVLAELQETRALIDDAEDQQRGYLITGDEQYLGRFEQALRSFGPKLEALAPSDGRQSGAAGIDPSAPSIAGSSMDELRAAASRRGECRAPHRRGTR